MANLQSLDEISACFLAALKIVIGKTPAPPHLAKAVGKLAKLITSGQGDEEKQQLFDAVKRFRKNSGRVNLKNWVTAVELCATRAGYVLCGNLETAASVINTETKILAKMTDENRSHGAP